MDHAQIIVHVLLVFPFGQCLSCQLLFLKLLDDRIIMFVPGCFLSRSHPVIQATAAFLKTGRRMDFIFLIRHLQVIDEIHILDNAHLLFGCGNTSFIFVIERFGNRINNIFIQIQVAGIWHPSTMGGFVMEQKAERFVFIALVIQPVQGQVRRDVCCITFDLFFLAVIDKVRIIIISLSSQNIPIIETGRIGCQVPLSDNSGLITGLLQQLRECLLATVKTFCIVGKAILMAMLAR